jgi:hypothetical protein
VGAKPDRRGFAGVLMDDPSPAPKIRLARMRVPHIRLAELMRAILKRGPRGIEDIETTQFAVELARRGVLDPVDHFRSVGPAIAVSPSGLSLIRAAADLGVELGLLRSVRKGRSRLCQVTKDGRETLEDWDDTTADGIY